MNQENPKRNPMLRLLATGLLALLLANAWIVATSPPSPRLPACPGGEVRR